jgi:hypothetical protein
MVAMVWWLGPVSQHLLGFSSWMTRVQTAAASRRARAAADIPLRGNQGGPGYHIMDLAHGGCYLGAEQPPLLPRWSGDEDRG